jgi:hypothetical protein
MEVILHDLVTYPPDDDGRIIAHFECSISWGRVKLCIENTHSPSEI